MGTRRAALALLVVVAPAVASAQSAKDKKKAGELVKQAIAKSQAGEHEEAVERYLEAYKLVPTPLLLSNIGSEYQQMNKPVEALDYFCKYLGAEPTGNMAGYATAQAKTLYIELGGITDVADADVCKPIVKPAPKEDPKPDPVVEAKPVEPPPPTTSEPKASPLRWVGVGLGAIGAGVFGLGVYYGLQAKQISDDISNHDPSMPWPGNINQLEEDGKSYEKKQIMFMIGGGVAVATGVTLFLLGGPKKPADATSVTLSPIATPDTLGFAAAGRF